MRKLTDIGGEFPAWGADGTKVHWSIGNAHIVYDLEEAKAVEEQLKLEAKEKAKQEEQEAEQTDEAEEEGEEGEAEEGEQEDEGAEQEEEEEEGEQEEAEDEEDKGYKPQERRVEIIALRDTPEGVAVLRGARVITMRGNEIIDNADIVVRDNRIEAIGRRGSVNVPRGAREIDVSGKTIIPGFVDTHAHMWPNWGIHKTQVWMYLANLAYGVTTTRDPQTATTDVLTYSDMVRAGTMIGPRVYSTGPGIFFTEMWRDLDHTRDVLKRYSEYYDTKNSQDVHGGEPPAAPVDHHGGQGAGADADDGGRPRPRVQLDDDHRRVRRPGTLLSDPSALQGHRRADGAGRHYLHADLARELWWSLR